MQHANVDAYLPYGRLSSSLHSVGFLSAFCLQHHLLNQGWSRCCRIVTQCRYQEGPVSALFVALGAQLQEQHLSPMGPEFANRYLEPRAFLRGLW